MVNYKLPYLFRWLANLETVTKKCIFNLQFQHKQLCNDHKDAKKMDEAKNKYNVIRSWWLSFGMTTKRHYWSFQVGGVLALLLHAMGWSYDYYECLITFHSKMSFMF